MAWLVRGDDVLASAEIAATRSARRRGLLGRTEIRGVLVLLPARSVHTIGMRVPIDVAHARTVARDPLTFEVQRVVTMAPNRVGRPVRGADVVLEAAAGSFGRWSVDRGTVLVVRQ